jgi:hypothetical protein
MAGQPDGQLLAQPVDHMVRAGRVEQLQREPGPLRELRIDQAPDQRGVDCGAGVWIPRGCQEQLLESAHSVRRAVGAITVRRTLACRPVFSPAVTCYGTPRTSFSKLAQHVP